MAKKKTVLQKMKDNPRGWKIADIKTFCKKNSLSCEPPKRGSHYSVYSDHLADTLSIPANRPIKPIYIKHLTSYADAHFAQIKQKGKTK
ncbi:MAG: type II toxin-antitoxin system HicA family toxin [Alphaproteobacteria bacterium]|nr:type II toxin-antitoxin system HicA family toxin [Alphaproteobacteria bacterium]